MIIHSYSAGLELSRLQDWVAERVPKMNCGDDFGADAMGLGVYQADKLIAGVIFHRYTGFDVNLTIAADTPDWAKPGVLRALADLIFNKWGCLRLTTMVGASNRRAIRLNNGLGFVCEGILRRGLDGTEDAIIFGMLKEECSWLKNG